MTSPELETTTASTDAASDADDERFAVEVISEPVEQRLKPFNVCCSQGGCL